jgi:hypothetical protein
MGPPCSGLRTEFSGELRPIELAFLRLHNWQVRRLLAARNPANRSCCRKALLADAQPSGQLQPAHSRPGQGVAMVWKHIKRLGDILTDV